MDWQRLTNPEDIPSPGLLIDPERIDRNIERMISTVGRAAIKRLRPHVKSHKMAEVMKLQMEHGIHQFKAATITELEMVAASGAQDVLLAYQPVGPNVERFASLIERYPETSFAAVTDNLSSAQAIAEKLGRERAPFRLYIDVDCGMHRTGIALGSEMNTLRHWIETQPGVSFAGLHAYDGHLHQSCIESRKKKVNEIRRLLEDYAAVDPPPEIIVSGSPTFGIWADLTDWQCSPGTTLLWDIGYARAFPDLQFEIAACLLTRIISRPDNSKICLDLGHKAIAAENPIEQRVYLPALPGAKAIIHSEEHLVLECQKSTRLKPSAPILAFPKHICPTVALHASASIVRNGQATGESWKVIARDRI